MDAVDLSRRLQLAQDPCTKGVRSMASAAPLGELELFDNSQDEEMQLISDGEASSELALPSSNDADSRGRQLRELREGRRVHGPPKVAPLPAFGYSQHCRLEKLKEPTPHRTEPLGIHLRQILNLQQRKNWSPVVLPGREPTLRVYGTLRAFPCTHYTCGVLTRRNKLELPQCLFFDPAFREVAPLLGLGRYRDGEPAPKAVVSPEFAEWFMGVPRGWTARSQIRRESLQAHISSRQPAHEQKHRVISLFSGCGAFDFSMLPWCHPVAYCEKNAEAASVLSARMDDGSLRRGRIFEDIRAITCEAMSKEPGFLAGPSVDGLLLGFPCVDLCKAGRKRGLVDGLESNLVWEALRLAEELQVSFLWCETVDNVRFLGAGGGCSLVDALNRCGFLCKWVSLPATAVGCPQRRKRWFLYAARGSALGRPLCAPLDEALRTYIPQASGLSFNGGRPPLQKWMLPQVQHAAVRARLEMLGNAVIPLQGILAARLLSGGL